MAYNEEVAQLRGKFSEAVRNGVFDASSSDQFQGTLLMIMNECERRRQDASGRLEDTIKQEQQLRAEINTWSKMAGIMSGVLGTLTVQQARANEEEKDRESERKEIAEFAKRQSEATNAAERRSDSDGPHTAAHSRKMKPKRT